MLKIPSSVFTLFSFLVYMYISKFADGRRQCVKVIGRVHCQTDWDRHFGVNIWLMDQDLLPWETDDVMGETKSDEDGNFKIEGCAEDLFSWNDPDPYLLIEHRCPEPGYTVSIPRRHKMIFLDHVYAPDTIYIGSIRLDEDDNY